MKQNLLEKKEQMRKTAESVLAENEPKMSGKNKGEFRHLSARLFGYVMHYELHPREFKKGFDDTIEEILKLSKD